MEKRIEYWFDKDKSKKEKSKAQNVNQKRYWTYSQMGQLGKKL